MQLLPLFHEFQGLAKVVFDVLGGGNSIIFIFNPCLGK